MDEEGVILCCGCLKKWMIVRCVYMALLVVTIGCLKVAM